MYRVWYWLKISYISVTLLRLPNLVQVNLEHLQSKKKKLLARRKTQKNNELVKWGIDCFRSTCSTSPRKKEDIPLHNKQYKVHICDDKDELKAT